MNTGNYGEEQYLDTIQQLQMAIKSISSYPEDHPTSSQIIGNSYETLTKLFKIKPSLTLSNSNKTLLLDDMPISDKIFSNELATTLEKRSIDSITFCRGLSMKDFRVFLHGMSYSSHMLKQQGDLTTMLQQKGVSSIKINKIKYGKISEEEKLIENTYILDFLSGDNDSPGYNIPNFVEILENEPQRIRELIRQVSESADTSIYPFSAATEAAVSIETIKRISTELLTKQGTEWDQFKHTMISVLSTFDNDLLTHMSKSMETIEGDKDEIIDILTGELFYDTGTDICVNRYIEDGTIDNKLLERLFPTFEERENALPFLEAKLKELGCLDEGKDINEFLANGLTDGKESLHDISQDTSYADEIEEKMEDLKNMLSEGENDEANNIINEFKQKLDDESADVREKVANAFLDITSTLDKFDKLKGYFGEMSEILTSKLKQECHVDTYLSLSANYQNICTSLDKNTNFFRDETIGSRLFKANKLSKGQLENALILRNKNGKSLQYNMAALNYVDESSLLHSLTQQHRGNRSVKISEIHNIQTDVLKRIPIKFIKRYLVLPFSYNYGNLDTAIANPGNFDLINDIRFVTGCNIVPHLATEYHLLKAIGKHYSIEIDTPEINQLVNNIEEEEELEFIEELEEGPAKIEQTEESDAPVVRLVNVILKEAIAQQASDIHIEPFEDELIVRFRIDGTLTKMLTPSLRYAKGITSRIKIMSRLDISERRLPQDGKLKIKMDGRYVDVRVSTFPGNFGEKVVLRLLDQSNLILDIKKLGLNGRNLDAIMSAIHKSKRLILVTGPTGSGKTTTLYSMLRMLNDGSKNISTIEDPIEYSMKGINQFQTNSRIGLNFVRSLRSFLRQDPDIIMLGEMRDFETAEIAIKAALTGHLILTTLHTNSASEAIIRLLDMGIEPYLISSSASLIIAQRLMRVLCDKCKEETSPTDLQLNLLKRYKLDIDGHRIYKGKGCEHCNNTGYNGRIAIYEIMTMWHEIQELILKGASAFQIKEEAERLGLVTLQEQGYNKTIEGVTSLDEWVRVMS